MSDLHPPDEAVVIPGRNARKGVAENPHKKGCWNAAGKEKRYETTDWQGKPDEGVSNKPSKPAEQWE